MKTAFTELHPTGVWLSVDVFGLTAWKKTDFGVGQVVEKIMYLSGLLATDLGVDLRRMQPKPVYIDWLNRCRFVLY